MGKGPFHTAKPIWVLGASCLALVTATPALAQATGGVADPAAQDSNAPDATADREGNDIVVTARLSSERLQDVPVVVTAITAQQLEREGLDDLSDIAEKTVGFAFETFTGPLAQPVIRGQTNLRTTSPVQNVSTNLNGIYIQRGYFVDQGLLDLERVEIIKGPQSALYGRNAFAGVISLITRQPDVDELSGRIAGTVGIYDRYEVRGGINVPVIPGVLAVYAGGGYSKFDGTWRNNHPLADADGAFTRGRVGGWEKKAYQIGAKLRIGQALTLDGMYIRTERELESNPAYTLTTTGLTYQLANSLNASPTTLGGVRQNRLWVGELPAQVPIFPGETRLPGIVVDPRSYGLRGPSEIWMGNVKLDNGGPFTLQYTYGRTEASILARGSSARDPLSPTVIVPFGNFGTVFDSSGNGSRFVSDSHEGRVTFDFGGPITGFAGINFTETSDIESNGSEFAPVNSLVEPTGASFFPVAPGLAVPPTTPLFARNTFLQRNENVVSAYAFVQWKASEALTFTAEGRYTEEDQRGSDLIARDIGGLGQGFIAAVTPTTQRSAKFFTPRGSITYKFSNDNNIYATVGRGYKSGGINGVAANYNRTTTFITPGQPNQVFVDPIRIGTALPAVRTPPAGSTATVAFTQLSPGSANFSVLQERYEAETNWTYEIGSKNNFFNGALTLNLAAFYTDWKNIQSNAVRLQPDGSAPLSFAAIVPSVIGNVGDVQVYGAEISGVYRLTRELRLDFGASYNRARYREGVVSQRIGASGNCDGTVCRTVAQPGVAFPVLPIGGNQLERTPEFDALAGLTYDTKFDNGWGFFVRGDVTYQTRQFADEANLAFVPDRTLVNASAGISIGDINVQIWAKNLFDKQYVTSALFLVGTGGAGSASYVPILGERRTAGLTASFNF